MLRSRAHRAIAFAVAVALIGAAAATAALVVITRTQTATSGDVTATFQFGIAAGNTYPTKTLAISRAGQVAFDQPVTSKYCGPNTASAQKYCAPGAPEAGFSSVHALDLEHNGQPDVVLDLYTGGAHCCTVEQIFSFDPGTGTYVKTEHDFGDPGDEIKDLGHNGRLEFLTADDTFAYAFTDFADSGLPIQILTFAGGKFTNVTRQYPKLIAKDAAMLFKGFKHHLSNGDGLIAAWAADEYNLGHAALVKSTLAKELKAGHLRSLIEPGGQKFIRALNKLLRRDGYIR
jgi:hypothetical protein